MRYTSQEQAPSASWAITQTNKVIMALRGHLACYSRSSHNNLRLWTRWPSLKAAFALGQVLVLLWPQRTQWTPWLTWAFLDGTIRWPDVKTSARPERANTHTPSVKLRAQTPCAVSKRYIFLLLTISYLFSGSGFHTYPSNTVTTCMQPFARSPAGGCVQR